MASTEATVRGPSIASAPTAERADTSAEPIAERPPRAVSFDADVEGISAPRSMLAPRSIDITDAPPSSPDDRHALTLAASLDVAPALVQAAPATPPVTASADGAMEPAVVLSPSPLPERSRRAVMDVDPNTPADAAPAPTAVLPTGRAALTQPNLSSVSMDPADAEPLAAAESAWGVSADVGLLPPPSGLVTDAALPSADENGGHATLEAALVPDTVAGAVNATRINISVDSPGGAGPVSRPDVGAPATEIAPVETPVGALPDAIDAVALAPPRPAPVDSALTELVPPARAEPALALSIPTESAPPETVYPQRDPIQRRELVEQLGGSEETERAVADALDWLARHQSSDGRWSSRDFDNGCGACSGRARADVDVALTGLATLCFLGADYTHTKDTEHRLVVRRALDFILANLDDRGDLRAGETMYSQGIAAIALCEAFGMTGDALLREPAQRAIDYITRAHNSVDGGWRYEPGMAGDTSVLGWQVMALASARRVGLAVPQASLDAAEAWLDRVSRPRAAGLYSYQPGMPPTHSMTAEGMFVQQLIGRERDDPRMLQSASFVVSEVPDWRRDANTYLWYYSTLALFQHQGEVWTRWNEALTGELLAQQRDDGLAAGSWDPADRWSRIGGRVYQTALCTLSLEVYYRYLPLYMQDQPGGAPPAVRDSE